MGAYQTVAVGTDGSESSFRAVDRAAAIAGDAGATLLIISAYHPQGRDSDADHALGDESAFMVVGSAPAEQALSRAKDRALQASSDVKVDTLAVEGNPVEVVIKVTSDRKAELVVVGNKGLNSLAGRLLGSVPQSVSRQSSADVLIVHTV